MTERNFAINSWGLEGGDLWKGYFKWIIFISAGTGIMKSGMDAGPKFWCLGGSPLLPLTWPQSKGDLLAVGEPPTAGLRPHEPHTMDVLQNFWQLLSELQYSRRVKIQCPGARIRLGLALPVPCHVPLTKFPQSQCSHLLTEENRNLLPVVGS